MPGADMRSVELVAVNGTIAEELKKRDYTPDAAEYDELNQRRYLDVGVKSVAKGRIKLC